MKIQILSVIYREGNSQQITTARVILQ